MANNMSLLCLLLVGFLALTQVQTFRASLDGDYQIPPVRGFSGYGSCATFFINSTTWGYNVTVVDIPQLTLAHFHYGSKTTVDGPVVVPLLSLTIPLTIHGEADVSSTFRAANFTGPLAGKTLSDLKKAIQSDKIYCNVHTQEYPSGAIRGQMS